MPIAGLPRISVTRGYGEQLSSFQDPASTLNHDLFDMDREQLGAGVQLIRANAGATAKVVKGSIYGSLGGAPRAVDFVFTNTSGVGFAPRPVAVFVNLKIRNRIGERFS